MFAFALLGFELAQPGHIRVLNAEGVTEVYKTSLKRWQLLGTGDLIGAKDRLRSGIKSRVLLKPNSQMGLLLESRSQAETRNSSFFSKRPVCDIQLFGGSLLGYVSQGPAKLKVVTASAVYTMESAVFRLAVGANLSGDALHVLEGKVIVDRRTGHENNQIILHSMEKLKVSADVAYLPRMLDLDEWKEFSKAYELRSIPTQYQGRQKKLSREAGDFFRTIKDHGDFYTPQVGYFRREFFKDAATQSVLLKVYYNVMDPAAFAGFYMKTDVFPPPSSRFLEFEARSGDAKAPGALYLDFKSGGEVRLSFPVTALTGDWRKFQVPLASIQNSRIDEVILYLSYGMAGKFKHGEVFFRNFDLVTEADADARS